MSVSNILLAISGVSALAAALLLIWCENQVSCSIETAKFLETMFILMAVIILRETAK